MTQIKDPYDGKYEASAVTILEKYSRAFTSKIIGGLFDDLFGDRDGPEAIVEVTGDMTGKVTVPHGLTNADGSKAKPRTWHLMGFRGVDTVEVVSFDDTNITVQINNKGIAKIKLFA